MVMDCYIKWHWPLALPLYMAVRQVNCWWLGMGIGKPQLSSLRQVGLGRPVLQNQSG